MRELQRMFSTDLGKLAYAAAQITALRATGAEAKADTQTMGASDRDCLVLGRDHQPRMGFLQAALGQDLTPGRGGWDRDHTGGNAESGSSPRHAG